jgi:phosphoenolpyruvate carboxykinase (diphosphate)
MPGTVFPEEMLRPEKQDPAEFAEGVTAIVAAQRAVALEYFEDGSVEAACPPIKALLHIMSHGNYEGKCEQDPEIRALFTLESLLASDWYKARLEAQQSLDIVRWTRHRDAVESYLTGGLPALQLDLQSRLAVALKRLRQSRSDAWRDSLVGTIGADPAVRI